MSKILKSFGMAALLVALLAGTGMAADNAAMTLTGEVQESVEVTVSPASFTWTLNMGANTYTTQDTTSTITSNVGTGNDATLSVKETASGTEGVNVADGNMYSETLSDALDDDLELDATTVGALDIAALTGENQLLYTLAAAGTQIVDFDYKQAIASTDVAEDDYGIVVTFTGAIVLES